jgi:hypothetical protein
MNWYNLYKFAYNVSKDDILARKLSQDIFLIVKDNIGKDIYRDIVVDNKCTLQLYCSFKNYKNFNLRYEAFDIKGFFSASSFDLYDPYIRIEISFSNKFSDKYFESLIYVLYDAIKHELDHYRQYKNKEEYEYVDPNDFNRNNILEFYINRKNYLYLKEKLFPILKV